MKTRRSCREAALQALYQFDTLGEFSPESLQFFLDHFQAQQELDDDDAAERVSAGDLCSHLVRGVVEHAEYIDGEIARASAHWSLDRMSRVDRNIIRIATFEMAFCPDIPRKVSINEALEIAKRFAAPESPMFINGVLDKISGQLPAREE